MSSIDSVGGVNRINGHIQTARTPYTPPPRQPDQDSQRYTSEAQARTQKPAVSITLSPEAQRALSGYRASGSSTT